MTDRYYVSADTGDSYGMLLGPYDSKEEAEAKVHLGNRLANAAVYSAAFWGFGVTCIKDPDMQVPVTFDESGKIIGKGRSFKKSLLKGLHWPRCIVHL